MQATVSRIVFGVLSACCLMSAVYSPPAASAQEFERIVIDPNFPGAYQVEVADVNGDRKPDIVAVGGGTCAWYENPTWAKRVVTTPAQTPGVISSATADLDGDGKAEIAIAYEFAMNAPLKGKLVLAVQGGGLDAPWNLVPIDDIGSIHRLRWGDVDGDRHLDLVVAPIFGSEARPPDYRDPSQIGVYRRFAWRDQKSTFEKIARRPVLHAIDVVDLFQDGRSWIVTADDGGTSLFGWGKQPGTDEADHWRPQRVLTAPARGNPPSKRGASEVHIGRMSDGTRLLATIEPWHGSTLAVYFANLPPQPQDGSSIGQFGARTVLDTTLADGHALWVADVDGDGDDEVFAGHRGKDHRVSMYDLDRVQNKWNRTVLDQGIAAQDLRGGDLDGDGTPDVVAVGGATHNVVWYRPKRR